MEKERKEFMERTPGYHIDAEELFREIALAIEDCFVATYYRKRRC